jgi:hypothetical protein
VFAVREAVGQLFEYAFFLGPLDASLCILLDKEPEPPLRDYVEQQLRMFVVWWTERGVVGGRQTAERLAALGVSSAEDRQ